MKYFFVLGNASDLAREEVKALLPHTEFFYQPPVLIIETENKIPFEKFGGVIKIGEVINEGIIEFLKSSNQTKIDFGISDYGNDPARWRDDAKEIKRELQELGIKTRFILPKRGEKTLSSVVVKKQFLTEFLIFKDVVAKTIWVQDFEDWGLRDYGRPATSSHIGMLPPKVARMMVNIAGPGKILDPFCGVGTILAEAQDAIGSDINSAQIEKTRKNLAWLGKKFPLQVADARKVIVPPVDAIVTEPFLGPANQPVLEQLYYDCFKHWQTILKPDGKVVIATPFPLDTAKLMGYSILGGPFMYFRPQAIVKRYIWHIQKLPV